MAEAIATREAYGKALAEFGAKYDKLVVLDADLANATKTDLFKKEYPERHFDCGIAEANMTCVAAGLAASIFHFGEVKIEELKAVLYNNGIQVRRKI